MEKYCSSKFKTGEELDNALAAALTCCDEATRAETAADRAEAAVEAAGDIAKYAVTYSKQTLSETDKARARQNIGAKAENAQPDLSQNDETQGDFVKGRTHWRETSGTDGVVISERTANFGVVGVAMVYTEVEDFDVGAAYVVLWGTEEYEVVGQKTESGYNNYIGNPSLAYYGADNGLPFLIVGEGDGAYAIYPKSSGVKNKTVKVTGKQSVIYHKLDEEFLPESVSGIVLRSSTADSSKKFKLTIDDAGTISIVEV